MLFLDVCVPSVFWRNYSSKINLLNFNNKKYLFSISNFVDFKYTDARKGIRTVFFLSIYQRQNKDKRTSLNDVTALWGAKESGFSDYSIIVLKLRSVTMSGMGTKNDLKIAWRHLFMPLKVKSGLRIRK